MSEDKPDQIAEKTTAPITNKAATPQENPFADIIINVLVPVLVLSYLSEEGGKFWHIGPMWGHVLSLWQFLSVTDSGITSNIAR